MILSLSKQKTIAPVDASPSPKQQQIPPQISDTQRQQIQLFQQLSQQYKDPIRNMISQIEEQVLGTTTQLIQQIVQSQQIIKSTNNETQRLRKLCEDNKINWNPQPIIANRAQRREQERNSKKAQKKK